MHIFGRFHVIRCLLDAQVRGSRLKKPFQYVASVFKSRNDAEMREGMDPLSHGLPAGFGFAEDILGFHRGRVCQKRAAQLLIQLRYGLRDDKTGHKEYPSYCRWPLQRRRCAMTLTPADMLAIQHAIDLYEKKFPNKPLSSAEVALAWLAARRRHMTRRHAIASPLTKLLGFFRHQRNVAPGSATNPLNLS